MSSLINLENYRSAVDDEILNASLILISSTPLRHFGDKISHMETGEISRKVDGCKIMVQKNYQRRARLPIRFVGSICTCKVCQWDERISFFERALSDIEKLEFFYRALYFEIKSSFIYYVQRYLEVQNRRRWNKTQIRMNKTERYRSTSSLDKRLLEQQL